MEKINVMIKTGCTIILLLVFSINQASAAPCGDVNSSGAIDIVDVGTSDPPMYRGLWAISSTTTSWLQKTRLK